MEETNEKFCILPRRQREKTIWYYYIYDEDGKRIYRSTGQTNKAKVYNPKIFERKSGFLRDNPAKNERLLPCLAMF